MIGRYIPCAICISTGAVPQCAMKTPGVVATNSNCRLSPGATDFIAWFIGILEAWKSMECGMPLALLTRVMRTRSP